MTSQNRAPDLIRPPIAHRAGGAKRGKVPVASKPGLVRIDGHEPHESAWAKELLMSACPERSTFSFLRCVAFLDVRF